MKPEDILSHPARELSQSQREHYFKHGYVGVESLVPADIVSELVAVNFYQVTCLPPTSIFVPITFIVSSVL